MGALSPPGPGGIPGSGGAPGCCAWPAGPGGTLDSNGGVVVPAVVGVCAGCS